MALGSGAIASHANAAAFGQGVQTLFENQYIFGTTSTIYTLPGITSDASRTAQVGDLEFVLTDANGNLASDGGVFETRLTAAEDLLSTLATSNGGSDPYDDTALSQRVTTNTNNVTSLTTTVDSNTTRVASAETAIAGNHQAISVVSSVANSNQSRIANAET